MENIYIYMLIALAVLAIADLVVGVSNDAVNFLNSAIGSKAVPFKTIMIVASLGVAFGALSSSGMMEVARKGIFNPSQFMFDEIMIVFMAVMITDILLLDFFNTLGLPTSTTVSIVFELLGASVCIALIKISKSQTETLGDIVNYINNEKAIEIILGILLSVLVAFTIGALVQYLSRLLLSFKFNEKPFWYGAIFSGLAITSITYFILIKGLKSASFMSEEFSGWVNNNTGIFLMINFAIWTLLSIAIIKMFKANIYTLIIVVGTFALAMAFAGNDLVNFIGVPIAAFNSYQAWIASGIAADEFGMSSLAQKVPTQPYLLLIAGLIMVLTLWFSSKAKDVVKTSVDLSRQDDVKERFEPNFLSRYVVRLSIGLSQMFDSLLNDSTRAFINKQFSKPVIAINHKNKDDIPAFDLVRAAVNLMVASVLISLATSMKLPLSTTYVTFMVAMGTSLADRAWGSESAVYRVAGVFNVIGGWFFTAFSAFIAAAITAYLLNWNVQVMVPVLLLLAILLLVRNFILHKKKTREQKIEDKLERAESKSLQGVIHESADNIANVLKRGNKIYTNAIEGLARQDLNILKKNKKQVNKLADEIDDLRDNIFYFIKNLDEKSVSASNFYINILDYLTDMAQSLEYISRASHKHVNNNHKKLKFSQIKELKNLDVTIDRLFKDTRDAYQSYSFEKIEKVLQHKDTIYSHVTDKIQLQVERTRTEESSPKNTTLYFSILLETKDLLDATFDLLEEYNNAHDANVEPVKINNSDSEE